MRKTVDFLTSFFLYSFCAMIIMPAKIKPAFVICLGLVSLCQFIVQKKQVVLTPVFITSIALFASLGFSLMYSNNVSAGIKMLETKSSMLFFPVIFCLFLSGNKLEKLISVKKFSIAFFFVNSLYSIFLLIFFTSYTNPKYPNLYLPGFFQSAVKDIPFVGEQHTYVGLLLATSILMVAATSKDSKTLKKAVFFMCSALHVSVIWLLQPRAIIVGLMISTPFLVFRRIKIKASQLILIAGVLLLTLFVFTPTQNNRFLELKSASNYDQMNGASQRLVIFKCTLEQLKEKPFFGLGLGSTSKVIGSCFSEKTNDFSVKEYNTHNQYLDLWLTASPLSLLLFCLFLWMVFNNLIKSRRKALVSVVLLLTIAMFFENILERQTGVILFYFLVFLILDRSKKTMFTKELLIGPLAPPITGLSVSNKQALETFSKSGKRPLFINTAVHTFRERQGAFRLSTLFRFSRSFLECYKIACAKKVYFTPGQTFLGVLKYAPFILISRALGKQLIVHIHGNYIAEQYAILKGLKKKAFYFLLSLSHKGIVLSKSLKHNLLPFIPAKDIFILPNFYDHRLLLKQKEKTFSSIKICFLSNLMNEKGINVFLKALKMLSSSGVSFEANIGGHIDEEKADQLKEKINNIKNTTYHGIVKGPQKQKILQEANIFVLPTFYKMEGLPISIIEAMATGNVIITTLHAAIPDLINQEENGFYVEKKSATQIAKKIKQLAKDPEKMKKISTNNIKKAKKLYTSKIFSEKLQKIIDA